VSAVGFGAWAYAMLPPGAGPARLCGAGWSLSWPRRRALPASALMQAAVLAGCLLVAAGVVVAGSHA
jgi:hypothetical protein